MYDRPIVDPTIVFAAVQAPRRFELMRRLQVDAFMVTFAQFPSSLRALAASGYDWPVRTYLDSGIFTFLSRAGLSTQSKLGVPRTTAAWDEFKEFAKGYITYLKEHGKEWDYIIELDCSELFGVEIEDAFRKQLHGLLGDRLLPVWHAQRGLDGWREMIKEHPYVCLSTTRATSSERNTRNQSMIRGMVREAHERGVRIHMLGVTSADVFRAYEIDTADSSSWLSLDRYGQFQGPDGISVSMRRKRSSKDRAVSHGHIAGLMEFVSRHGYTYEEVEKSSVLKWELGIRSMQERQEVLRRERVTA